MIPQEKIDYIKENVNIVYVVSRYVELKQRGKSYVGLCPFHRERTPSFHVRPDKQMYYCFGCNEGGNVFSFLVKIEGISFRESVALAERFVEIKSWNEFHNAFEFKRSQTN